MTSLHLTPPARETHPTLWDSSATSSGALFRSGPALLCVLMSSAPTRSTSSGDDAVALCWDVRALNTTHCGLPQPEMVTPSSDAVCALRRLTGLTWGEVATLFGVSRRSVHHWASGGPLSPAHEAQLRAWLAAVEGVNAPSDAVRAALVREDSGPSLLSNAARSPPEALGVALRATFGAASPALSRPRLQLLSVVGHR